MTVKGQNALKATLSCCLFQKAVFYPKELACIFLSWVSPIRPQSGRQIIRERYICQAEWQRRVDISKVLFFKIEREPNDGKGTSRIWIYDRNGEFLGQHYERGKRFNGRNPEKLRFQKGDLVQFVTDFDPLLLQLGVILGIPMSKQKVLEVNRKIAPLHLDESDNTYAVYTCFGEAFGHYHLPECYLFEPNGIISNIEREKLLGLLALSQ